MSPVSTFFHKELWPESWEHQLSFSCTNPKKWTIYWGGYKERKIFFPGTPARVVTCIYQWRQEDAQDQRPSALTEALMVYVPLPLFTHEETGTREGPLGRTQPINSKGGRRRAGVLSTDSSPGRGQHSEEQGSTKLCTMVSVDNWGDPQAKTMLFELEWGMTSRPF